MNTRTPTSSRAQLIDLLAARHRNVMVVGDDAQSIYSWRGANFENILKFSERYPEARTYKIETNYRSTPEILKVANAAIAGNVRQFAKQLPPVRKSGPRPSWWFARTASSRPRLSPNACSNCARKGSDLNRMAVLYRSHFHALELQLELTRRNIPFSITSGIRFFEQAHIKDITAYLKLVANPRDEVSFIRLAQMLPGIGGKGAARLWKSFTDRFAKEAAATAPAMAGPAGPGAPRAETVAPEPGGPQPVPDKPAPPAPPARSWSMARDLQGCAPEVPKKAAVAWAQFVATVSQLEAEELRPKPSAMLGLVMEAGYEDYLEDNYTNYRSRLEDLTQLASFARQFPTSRTS